MSATGLEVFDTTLQRTHTWLKDLMLVLGWQDRHKAYRALRATLHALRDRLTVEETAHLGAQLPMLIRGFYYEGWDPSGCGRGLHGAGKPGDRRRDRGCPASAAVRDQGSVARGGCEPAARLVAVESKSRGLEDGG